MNRVDSRDTDGEHSGHGGEFGKGSFLMSAGCLQRLEKWREVTRQRGGEGSRTDGSGGSSTLLDMRRERERDMFWWRRKSLN